jgi:hypothetical protein
MPATLVESAVNTPDPEKSELLKLNEKLIVSARAEVEGSAASTRPQSASDSRVINLLLTLGFCVVPSLCTSRPNTPLSGTHEIPVNIDHPLENPTASVQHFAVPAPAKRQVGYKTINSHQLHASP